MSLIKELQC